MKYADINKKYTAVVTGYLAQGYTINTRTMNGSQGEYAHIDLTDGTEVIRIILKMKLTKKKDYEGSIRKVWSDDKEAKLYCTDGYRTYLDVVFPGKHVYNPHSKNDTFTVEGVNADLRHYIPTLARRSRCFPRKLENLAAVLSVFVRAYNRFGIEKAYFASYYPHSAPPFSLFDFL